MCRNSRKKMYINGETKMKVKKNANNTYLFVFFFFFRISRVTTTERLHLDVLLSLRLMCTDLLHFCLSREEKLYSCIQRP